MLGENPIRHRESTPGLLQVRDIFYTLQGEGPFAGWPSVFIRLSGCNLACHFCDTQWDDENDQYLSIPEIVDKVKTWQEWKLIVLTGGEPLRQDLDQLIAALPNTIIQIETAGTLWQDCLVDERVRIVVSPKTPKINSIIYNRANAFKYVIKAGEVSDIDGLPIASTQISGRPALLARPRPGAPVYLSPCDELDPWKNDRNRNEVVRLALRHGYIAGLQLHKIWNVE